jgi:probable rRNA maturation factor
MLKVLCRCDEPEFAASARTYLEQLAGRVMDRHRISGDIDLILSDDSQLRRLNSTFRGIDRTTDVLSFDYTASDEPPEIPGTIEGVRGEIYISRERAASQAVDMGVGELEEIGRLMVHALLHIAGFDHDTPEKLAFMESETDMLTNPTPQTVLADSVARKE